MGEVSLLYPGRRFRNQKCESQASLTLELIKVSIAQAQHTIQNLSGNHSGTHT